MGILVLIRKERQIRSLLAPNTSAEKERYSLPARKSDTDVAIIGAGAAGIAAARRLRQLGVDYSLLEARDRVGGRAHTIEITPGVFQDLGAQFLHSGSQNPLVPLAREQGFTVPGITPDWSRRLAPTPLDDAGIKERQAAIESAFIAVDQAGKKGLDDAISNHLGSAGAWEGLFRAIITWHSSREADSVSTLDVSRYLDTHEDWSILEGYGSLIAHFSHGLNVALCNPVTSIERDPTRFRVETPNGILNAQRLIIALPVNVLRNGLLRMEPGFPEEIREALEAVPMGCALKAVFTIEGRDSPFGRTSSAVGKDSDQRTGAYLIRPQGYPLVNGFYGGENARALEQSGPQTIEAIAREELKAVFGGEAGKSLTFRCSTTWNQDPLSRGAYSAALPGLADRRLLLAECFDDQLFLAGEHCSINAFSTVHGAWETGLLAADRAAASLA
ncbi:NAD(P)/FAD-dependent oxidoreductase [Limibacillus sp. MBR-115]|jgi:monoamine oxidase|uniref:flavin monoamine oxidase family protein n=1 Tax=Limibacillus sp. MBR-115 TaxID=3156465 RepID=UPI003391573F